MDFQIGETLLCVKLMNLVGDYVGLRLIGLVITFMYFLRKLYIEIMAVF